MCVSVEEIEQMTGLFQQKQRELLVAVSRVEELSDQLEALRSNRLEPPLPPPSHHHHNTSTSSTAELERLYKELQVSSQARTLTELQHGLQVILVIFQGLCISSSNTSLHNNNNMKHSWLKHQNK